MDSSELLEHSDSSDEDYVPEKSENNASEVESDGDPEDNFLDNEPVHARPRKRSKSAVKSRKKRKALECDDSMSRNSDSPQLTEEEKKRVEEDVWANFMKDTGFQSKSDRSENIVSNKTKLVSPRPNSKTEPQSDRNSTEKVKITTVFKFAGEDVTVEKEVLKDSTEAKSLNQSTSETAKKSEGRSKGNFSGISGILSQLGKKPKINTLEKSKLDWDQFKKEEKLEEELQTFNRGKDGYLEKQDFLKRADLRRFEIEKEIRTIERNKRVNN